jgi:hypothetical protein
VWEYWARVVSYKKTIHGTHYNIANGLLLDLHHTIVRQSPRLFMSQFLFCKNMTECYNFSCHVTVSPLSDHMEWPAQLLESRLAYFVLGVTLTADSGLGFTHMCSHFTIVQCLRHHAILCLAYRPASAYLLIASATLTKHSPMFTCVCTGCALSCI